MSIPSDRRTVSSILNDLKQRVRVLEALPGRESPTWQTATMINGWASVGTPFFDVAYRSDKRVENDDDFRGMLDSTAATSGTVAFVVDPANRPEADISFLGDTDDEGSIVCGVARFLVESSTGNVYVYIC